MCRIVLEKVLQVSGGEGIDKKSHTGFLRTLLIFVFLVIVSTSVLPKRKEVDLLLFYLSFVDFASRIVISYVIYGYRYIPMKIGMSLISLSGLLKFLNSYLVLPRPSLLETASSLTGCSIVALSLMWFFREFITEEIHKLLYNDSLTGVFNRQAFLRMTGKKLRSLKEGETACLIYLDLDGFKTVNDQYGHRFGDKLLQAVARRIKSSIRSNDLLGRIGGDEFVVFLPNSNAKVAEEVLRRINEKLSEPFVIDGITIELSLSAGIAVYPTDGQSLEELIEVSDRAMYENKFSKEENARVRRGEKIVG